MAVIIRKITFMVRTRLTSLLIFAGFVAGLPFNVFFPAIIPLVSFDF